MSKLYYIPLSMALLLCACQPETDPDALEKELRLVLEAQQNAWNRGDLEGFLQHYHNSADLCYVSPAGVLRGHRQLAERYADNYATPQRMGMLIFDVLDVIPAGANHAYLVGTWQLQREGDAPGGYFTLLFQKLNNQWTIIADHTS